MFLNKTWRMNFSVSALYHHIPNSLMERKCPAGSDKSASKHKNTFYYYTKNMFGSDLIEPVIGIAWQNGWCTLYFIIDSGLWKSFQTMVGLEKTPLQAVQTHSVPKPTSVWLVEISQRSKPRGSVCQVVLSFHGKPSRKVNSCGIAHRCLY